IGRGGQGSHVPRRFTLPSAVRCKREGDGMTTTDVLIVGGGVIGGSIAYHLAERGIRVTVLERGRHGGHASLASAGLLHPQVDPEVPAGLRLLSALGCARFPELSARLREVTGIDPQYQACGWLRIALE